ncbi:MAG: THUMP domain-containing protein [Candidatus Thermoplasmatota archaeon]
MKKLHSLIFEVSLEHKYLPEAEVISTLRAEKIRFEIEEKANGILCIDLYCDLDSVIKRLKERLALTHAIDIELAKGKNLNFCIKKIRIEKNKSFCVRARRICSAYKELSLKEIEKEVGGELRKYGKVSLTSPHSVVRVILSDKIYIGLEKARINRGEYEKRKAHFRPFFLPVSLHPRIARAIVNLSCVKKGQKLYDPFCGTGGLLIEAGLIGAKIIGSDIDERMVYGALENLSIYGLSGKIFSSDVGEGIEEKVDAIVCDPPYGRSSSTMKEKIENLYSRAFEKFRKILKKDGKVVIILPDKKYIPIGEKYFLIKENYSLKVHKSLTREICVYANYNN